MNSPLSEHPGRPIGRLGASNPIAVVGGSAAGLFTACLLSKKGRRVAVFEQSEQLEPASRTLIVTHRMREMLGALGEPCVTNEIRRFEIWSEGRSVQVSLGQPDLIIERSTLIRTLAEHARAAGTEMILGQRFLRLSPDPKAPGLVMEKRATKEWETVPASIVIGADGALSEVARSAGWPRPQTVPLLQAVVRLRSDCPADTVRVWFVPEETPYFYWLIPEADGRGALGLIGEDGEKTRSCLEKFLVRHGFEPLEYQGARIPVYSGWVPVHRRVAGMDVYLVGDAASQVKVTTVGGIVTGLRGAHAVSSAILNSDGVGELRSLRRELDLHLLVRRSLHQFSQQNYSDLLALLNPAVHDSLTRFHRDDAFRMLLRLCRNQPRLLWLGLRGLLAGRGSFANRNS